jgi:hypothetical protein
MKKFISSIIVATTLCLGMAGCSKFSMPFTETAEDIVCKEITAQIVTAVEDAAGTTGDSVGPGDVLVCKFVGVSNAEAIAVMEFPITAGGVEWKMGAFGKFISDEGIWFMESGGALYTVQN